MQLPVDIVEKEKKSDDLLEEGVDSVALVSMTEIFDLIFFNLFATQIIGCSNRRFTKTIMPVKIFIQDCHFQQLNILIYLLKMTIYFIIHLNFSICLWENLHC